MPDPREQIHVSVESPERVQLKTVFGSGYGTIAKTSESGVLLEAPVLLHSIRVLPDYQALVERDISSALKPDMMVSVIGSGTGIGPLREIPVIEVMVNESQTLSEVMVQMGYAVPRDELLVTHLRRDELIAALRYARNQHKGIWSEFDASALTVGISPEIDKITAAPPQAPAWIGRVGILVIIAVVLLLAWRESYWRQREPKWKQTKGMRIARWALAIPTFGLFNLAMRPGLFRPLPETAVEPEKEAEPVAAAAGDMPPSTPTSEKPNGTP